MVLYIEQTDLQSGARAREWIPFGVELLCCTFRLQSWTHKSHCDIHFIDLVLRYLPFYSSTQCKTHLSQLLSPSPILRQDEERALLGVNFHHVPINLSFHPLLIYGGTCLHNDNAVSTSHLWRSYVEVERSTCVYLRVSQGGMWGMWQWHLL